MVSSLLINFWNATIKEGDASIQRFDVPFPKWRHIAGQSPLRPWFTVLPPVKSPAFLHTNGPPQHTTRTLSMRVPEISLPRPRQNSMSGKLRSSSTQSSACTHAVDSQGHCREHSEALSAHQAISQSRNSCGFFDIIFRRAPMNLFKPTYNYEAHGSVCRVRGTLKVKQVTSMCSVSSCLSMLTFRKSSVNFLRPLSGQIGSIARRRPLTSKTTTKTVMRRHYVSSSSQRSGMAHSMLNLHSC